MRHLRDYEYVAHTEHFCDICGYQIQTGDLYRGQVMLDAERHRVVVFKTHQHPGCPPGWEDDEREIMEHMEKSRKSEAETKRKSSKRAA